MWSTAAPLRLLTRSFRSAPNHSRASVLARFEDLPRDGPARHRCLSGPPVPFAIRLAKKLPEGDLRARAAMQAPQSTPSTPLGACGTWGPPPDVATVRNRHWRLLGLQNDPNGGWAARQSPTWWPTTWPHPVPPHSPTAPPGRGGPWGRGLWHTRSDSAAWLGLAGPGGRLPARNRPIWAPGAPGQLPPQPL